MSLSAGYMENENEKQSNNEMSTDYNMLVCMVSSLLILRLL